jgi:hypothetical protein
MKKLIVFMLVLGMVSMANATIIDLVARGVGSMGHSGTINDPLENSEILYVDIVLNHNPYSGYPSYDGYALYGMDLDLHISGSGSLGHDTYKNGDPKLAWDSRYSVTGFSGIGDDGNIASINGGSLSGNIQGQQGGTVLVSGLYIHCDGPDPVVLDLTLAGTTKYSDYMQPGGGPYPGDTWFNMIEEQLGDLVIYQPEPMTIALLGLGGLFLRRRK